VDIASSRIPTLDNNQEILREAAELRRLEPQGFAACLRAEVTKCGFGVKYKVSMTDIFSKAHRSKLMARVRGVNTQPEKLVRAFLRSHGFHFRLHVRALPGKPDIVIPPCRAVIFVNGCFWHYHAGCKRSALPSTRKHFWRTKILGNALRDRRNKVALRRLGWRVFTVWQCQLSPTKARKQLASLVKRLTT
jgi:DNA mismatch endonuclease (patch repair protein)